MKNQLIKTTDIQDAAVVARFDGENPYYTCSFYDEDHLADIKESVLSGNVEAITESGELIGYLLRGNPHLVAQLNSFANRSGCVSGMFATRAITNDEVASVPWGVFECLVDEKAGGIVGYMLDDNADRIMGLLNSEATY